MKPPFKYWLVLIPIALACSGCVPLFYHSYENSFAGLGKRLDQAARTNAAMQMVLVHGMGDHCPGYGETFANNIARQLGLTRQPDGPPLIPLVSSVATNWLREFSYAAPPRILKVYELTWTPTTYSLKTNAFAKDTRLNAKRVKINKDLKNQVMEEGFGDAILYLNPAFRPRMQEPIRQTIEHVETRAGPNDKIVLVASSLGSKMTFDTVEKWAASDDETVKHFAGRTSDIVMLANQVPLLHLASGSNVVEHPHETSVKAFVRISRAQKQKIPGPPDPEDTNRFNINIVAATDPNDLLSYPLRDSDVVPEEPGNDARVKIVFANMYSHNAWAIPFLFEHPANAHTDYDQNKWLIRKLVKGFSGKKDPLPKYVPDTFSCDQKPKKHI